MKQNLVIKSEEKDGAVLNISFIDGLNYRLQHPGNRTYMQWQQDAYSAEKGIDTIALLDNIFENCVIPDGHNFRPSIDNVTPRELEVWQKLLRRFLHGEIETEGEVSA